MKKLAFALALISLAACENTVARKFGGNVNISLPCDQKLVNATWKEDNIWYLTRQMGLAEEPTTLTFREKSVYGTLEGQVTLVESRCGE